LTTVLPIEFSSLGQSLAMKIVYVKMLSSLLFIGFLCQCNMKENQNSNQSQNENNAVVQELETSQTEQLNQASEFPSINIEAGQVVESPLKIIVNSEGKWGGFEGELGTIELFDQVNNTIGLCILSTTENWMVNGPVVYNCDLEFNASSTGDGRLVVKNNNPTYLSSDRQLLMRHRKNGLPKYHLFWRDLWPAKRILNLQL